MYSLPMESRRDLRKHGVPNLDYVDSTVFYRSFRFEKSDLDDLIAGLLLRGEVQSVQLVLVPGREALCRTLQRLVSQNRLCDLKVFSRHSSVASGVYRA
ncbi:hypothetical protein HPB49_012492 [Dermacentor silvarum]|uniref:Uncharacterized protein n=1 Tax=Dermacentor silvarum TaxID=543639 RepID=A0ACB8C3M3_DERSI|nr:hypothetical protein HPB49_012492 [Dermacentor silvarum]